MNFDPTKPCTTRDGRAARIIATDKKGGDSIVALVTLPNNTEQVTTYQSNGRYLLTEGLHERDLVNVPEKRKVWLCFTQTGETCYFDTAKEAQAFASKIIANCVIAIKEVEYTIGEGL